LNQTNGYHIVTIDGPAASGKSTTARLVAKELGWLYLDTGAMYRALTVKVLKQGIPLHDAEAIGQLAETTDVQLIPVTGGTQVFVDGADVTELIRAPDVDHAVGPVCEVGRVRQIMVRLQRQIAHQDHVVAEGRDMGTVVFPEADLKFYMTASVDARAHRRLKEMAQRGIQVTLNEIREEIIKRDERDSNRSNSPLKQADDAIVIDTSTLEIAQQVAIIIHSVREKIERTKQEKESSV